MTKLPKDTVVEIGRDMGRELAIRADERRRIAKGIRAAAEGAMARNPDDAGGAALHLFAIKIADMLEGIGGGDATP